MADRNRMETWSHRKARRRAVRLFEEGVTLLRAPSTKGRKDSQLQIDPQADVPLDPPSDSFGGDALRLALAPVSGGVQVSADRPNAPGIVTELMLQRLPSVHCRTYLQRYRTALFTGFESGLSVVVPCAPGVWAVAARFVRAATGQMGAVMEIGVAVV